ncbi:alkaline phosphatase PafA [Runella slithyformis]|uniref:Type I phosphodiesterase/nucleotide pyrophosphatase n=1 Tax=Runella slithyformis (strain ATCC 29530 / DSM 19594 / LMG 11500 / NCIMB 11436 / LSU 4) TaxID=761193 RepID=A0A7U4E8K9_RUNSL|nr:alkaline phosphatase PafA [Runella slithyformis]AEI51463.1 type I phosphodiesterase/nucleotide pyrophosphatase [Runella slithyformis DSM 19594]
MHYFKLTLAILCTTTLFAQTKKTVFTSEPLARPKLVVGVVVDQMRYDYWYRYFNKYTEGGFKRLLREGYNCRNHHYHYALTVTAAGHASVYTGSTPAIHGIVGNDWYDRKLGKGMYCVADSTVQSVGTTTTAGKMSPKNLLVSTITDQLRIGTNFQGKTIGVAIKDRGAILPAGHTANGAYWFDSKTGNWITSTFYVNDLPKWVKEYNARKRPSELMKQNWTTLLPIEQYTESTADDQPYESKLAGAKKSVFPYDLAGIAGDAFGILASTPHGNTITKEIALEALKHENLGKGPATDFLAISFSTPDYVGHAFGPNSIEEEDIYLRLDRDFAEILTALDNQVGKGNYLFFISADHAVMDVVDLWKQNRLPAGRLNLGQMMTAAKKALNDKFGEGDYITISENYQLYLNHATLETKKIEVEDVCKVIRKTLIDFDGIAEVINLHDLGNANLNEYLLTLYKNGNHAKRSGDIQLVTEPGWMSGTVTATHGSPYNYDTHIPLLFYGWGITHGETFSRTSVADTAPTLAALLKILEPSGNIGKVIEGVMKK